MRKFRSFEEIQAWQESRKLVKAIRQICKREKAKKDFSFIDQITRSARSICANIAEGNESMTIPDFIRFLGIAKSSAAEVRSHLYDALGEEYLTKEEFVKLADLCKKISSMIAKLIHHLQSLDPTMKRTFKESKPEIELTN